MSRIKCTDLLKQRQKIYGFFALWIVWFHCYSYAGFPNTNVVFAVVKKVLSIGNIGVDVFLFLSAMGLYQSCKKSDIRKFYINRIKRVVLPYLVCALLYYIWFDFVYLQDGIVQYILNVTTINWWITLGGRPLWYVSFIFLLYAIYPVLNRRKNATLRNDISSCCVLCILCRYKN